MEEHFDAQIDVFIDRLARADTAPDAYNQYAYGDVNNAIRRRNLSLYLQQVARRQPDAMLVMEAPGYRGCRLTGLPVTSRKLMLEGLPEIAMFGSEAGYRDVADAGFEGIYGEQSATIVWGALADLGARPLIWNAFPFHPCKFHPGKPGSARSNRKPRRAETAAGALFLRQVMRLSPPRQVIAVGNVAFDTLGEIGVDCDKVRHPAHGGKKQFVAGLRRLLG